MKICVIGTGYVGLVVGAGLAEFGNDVICVDNNEEKLEQLRKGIMPIYESGLEELVEANVKKNRLTFSSDIKNAIKKSLVCFIAVGTPQDNEGSANLEYVKDVAKTIGKSIENYTVIVDKSTVPVGTADEVTQIIKNETNVPFDIVSNPEFLKQGCAVDDFLKPDRVIIGTNSDKATEIMKELYEPLLRTGNLVIIMDVKSAEMTKYAANSFLALRISYMNEIANICEKVGADVENVRIGISSDKRIGPHFLFSGVGYGGSCLPKDVKALISTAKKNGYNPEILTSIDKTNKYQKKHFVDKILSYYKNDIKDKTFGVWGLSFKPKTDDMREAPSIDIINKLLENGAKVKAYDPKAIETAKSIFKDKILYEETSYDAVKNADALIVLTEWNEFRRPDFKRIKDELKEPVIFDGRNQFAPNKLKEKGFNYISIGRK